MILSLEQYKYVKSKVSRFIWKSYSPKNTMSNNSYSIENKYSLSLGQGELFFYVKLFVFTASKIYIIIFKKNLFIIISIFVMHIKSHRYTRKLKPSLLPTISKKKKKIREGPLTSAWLQKFCNGCKFWLKTPLMDKSNSYSYFKNWLKPNPNLEVRFDSFLAWEGLGVGRRK